MPLCSCYHSLLCATTVAACCYHHHSHVTAWLLSLLILLQLLLFCLKVCFCSCCHLAYAAVTAPVTTTFADPFRAVLLMPLLYLLAVMIAIKQKFIFFCCDCHCHCCWLPVDCCFFLISAITVTLPLPKLQPQLLDVTNVATAPQWCWCCHCSCHLPLLS